MGQEVHIGNEVASVDQGKGNSVTEEGSMMEEGDELGPRATRGRVLI